MGIKLMVEVLDHYHGADSHKLWLLALAESANDGTRTGWPPREEMARRTGRSASRCSHVAADLVSEGVIKRDGGGNRGGTARFILLPLTADGKSAARPHPFDGLKGAARAHPKPEIKGAESARKGAGSSLPPAETASLPLIKNSPQKDQSARAREGDVPDKTTRLILDEFFKRSDERISASSAGRVLAHLLGRHKATHGQESEPGNLPGFLARSIRDEPDPYSLLSAYTPPQPPRAVPNGHKPVSSRPEWEINRS